MAVTKNPVNSEFIENEINNTQSNKITITEDKLYRKLSSVYINISRHNEWIGALGVVVSITLALLTANFKSIFGLSSRAWFVFFVLFDIAALVYFVITLIWKFKDKVTIDDIIKEICS